jgi:hypothetical protein
MAGREIERIRTVIITTTLQTKQLTTSIAYATMKLCLYGLKVTYSMLSKDGRIDAMFYYSLLVYVAVYWIAYIIGARRG